MNETIADAIPGAVGAIGGAGGVAWLTKVLLGRMVQQYDKKHEHHIRKHEALAEKLNQAITRLAVLESLLEDARRLRIDLEQRFSMVRAESETRIETMHEEMNNLRRDVYVAHERLRALAAGDQEISKIQAPPVVRRR